MEWQLKISRHYLLFFLFFLLNDFCELDLRQLNISRHYFVFSFFCLILTYYLAWDSCKKWQEIINKLGMISQIEQLPNFLVTIFFLLFFFRVIFANRTKTVENFSSLLCFCFFLSNDFRELDWDSWKFLVTFLFFLFFFRVIFANRTKTVENFSSLFCFFFFFVYYLPTISRGIVVKSDKK